MKLIIAILLAGVANTALADVIVIDRETKTLTYTADNGTTKTYPVVVGKPSTPTPDGVFFVMGITYNPTWNIPPSIQRERARKGEPNLTSIPPGPNNPLGKVFIRIDDAIGIHGNNMRKFRPGAFSHGCIRMDNKDALELAGMVGIDTVVHIQ